MTSITAQQTKLDLELVPKENQLNIGKCNGRIPHGLKPNEETFQVVLDALTLTPCYPAFIITADVPEKKRFKLTLEVFRDILQICPRVQGRDFDALPSEEDTLSFLRDLGHTGVINSLNDVVIDQMHQPWRTFAAIINRSLSGKTSGFDKLCLSRAQILWGMYHQKYVDYVELLWEDFTYQIDNKVYKKQEKMYYPRFTKVIIHHFLIQDKTLSWRNKIGMHTSKDDYLINTLRFVSRKEASQIYGAVLPECLTSPNMKESKAFKTYLGHATGVVPPKIARKFKKASPYKKDSIHVQADEEPVHKGKRETPLKEVRKKSLRDFHKTHPSGSGIVAEKPPSVKKITPTITSEGTSDKPGVPDVTEDDSTEKEEEIDQENESEDEEVESDEDKGMDDTTDQFDDDVGARLEEPTQTKEVVQVFRFNDRITTLEKEVAEIKKDHLHTQVTSLVDEHLDTRLGETREEFMNFLSESLTTRIKEQVKDQLPQILPKEVSNFAPPVIEKMIEESRNEVTLAKVSSQPQSTYESASTLTEFELKRFFSTRWRKRGRKDKDKDEDPSAGSDRELKKRKLSKDAEPTKGTKSQPKSFGKSVQSEEPMFEVADSDLPQDQEGNLGDNEDEPRNETASRCDWFKKPTPPQEPTNLDWNIGKTTQEGPTQNWLMTLVASTSTNKSLKDFDELMSTPIDFSGYILNGLKIKNLTQEILLGPAFRLLKGTHSNYAELEYHFEECYKALLEKLD
ncbi:hypothetical protein Tco_1209614 [Tanacetum coccineum]